MRAHTRKQPLQTSPKLQQCDAPAAAKSTRATLTEDEAADYIGFGRSTLGKLRLSGGGPRYLKLSDSPRGRVVYRPCDLDAWLESRIRRSTSEVTAAA
jgi:hypothetical protein